MFTKTDRQQRSPRRRRIERHVPLLVSRGENIIIKLTQFTHATGIIIIWVDFARHFPASDNS